MNGISLSTFKSDFTLYLSRVYKHYLKVLCPYPELQNNNNGIAVFGGDSYTYGKFMLMYGGNQINIAKQLAFN